MIASKVEFTTWAFKPPTPAIALTMSGSMPITVWPSGAMNSFGAYCASLATISVPLALTEAGTWAAIAGFAFVAAAFVLVVEVELLLPPQPANARAASAGTPRRVTSLLIGNLLIYQFDRSAEGRAGPAYLLFTESSNVLPALRTALRSRSY